MNHHLTNSVLNKLNKIWCSRSWKSYSTHTSNRDMITVDNNWNLTGRGANVILDSVGGCNWEKNLSSLAVGGRWVLYGTMGGKSVEGDLLGRLLSKRGQLLSSLLRSRHLQVRSSWPWWLKWNCLFCFLCVLYSSMSQSANLWLPFEHNVHISVLTDSSFQEAFVIKLCDYWSMWLKLSFLPLWSQKQQNRQKNWIIKQVICHIPLKEPALLLSASWIKCSTALCVKWTERPRAPLPSELTLNTKNT